MRTEKVPFVGELSIGDITLECAVTEDGTRLLSKTEIVKALGKSQGGSHRGADNMPRFISAKNLLPYIDESLKDAILNPIYYKGPKGSVSHGIPATMLPKLCEVWLRASDNGVLTPSQLPTYENANILMRGLAHVGIIALVDEATGYQDFRKRDELSKILEAYISQELLPRQRRFPPEFYKQLFRLRGWPYDAKNIARPGVVGTYTNQLIYDKLPSGTLAELKKKTPKNSLGNYMAKFHQSLSPDVGHPHLDKQLTAVITLMRASETRDEFMRMFERTFPDENRLFNEVGHFNISEL